MWKMDLNNVEDNAKGGLDPLFSLKMFQLDFFYF